MPATTMLRPKTSQCLLCSFGAAKKQPHTIKWPQQQTASVTTRQYPSRGGTRPGRMDLAAARQVDSKSGKPGRRKQDGPFGGMNLKTAGIRGMPERAPEAQSPNHRKTVSNSRATKTNMKDKDTGFKALKMQRALAPVSYGQRTRIKSQMAEVESFETFTLLKALQQSIPTQALKGMDELVPTPVQKIAIPALLGQKIGPGRKSKQADREEFLIAAETGSGKTLSYLIPTINAVKEAEAQDAELEKYQKLKEEEQARENSINFAPPPLSNMPHPTTGRPRAVILVPTSELVEQVGRLVKSFSHTVKFRSAIISANYTGTVIRNRLFSPKGIDILVSTPHLLSSIADSDPNILSRVTHLIVDEADSLMDRGFAPLTSAIIDRASPSLRQLVLCSATIPRSLNGYLQKRFPDIRRLVTPNLHAIPRRVQLAVVDIDRMPYQGNRLLACADQIWSIGKAGADHDGPVKGQIDVKRILVFVNERETTQEVTEYLVSKGIDAIALSRDTPEHRQSEMMDSFTSAIPTTVAKEHHPGGLGDNQPNYVPFGEEAPPVKRMLPNVKVVVTTDLGSRGIDTLAVRNVVLYDVPHSTIDFIHRLGRTGRMGRRGRGIVLVGKKDRRDIVAEVKDGMFRGQALI